MRKTAVERIKSLAEQQSDMPYDGIITTVLTDNVTVRPVGQTRARSIRNVKIPSHINGEDIRPGMPCKLDKSLSTPTLAAVFPGIESKGYSGIGTIIPNPPILSAYAWRNASGEVFYDVTTSIDEAQKKYISAIKLYFKEENGSASLYGKVKTDGTTTIRSKNNVQLWFAGVAISGLNESNIGTWVTAEIPIIFDATFQDRFSLYGDNILAFDSTIKSIGQFAWFDTNDGTNWVATSNTSNPLYDTAINATFGFNYQGGNQFGFSKCIELKTNDISSDTLPHNFCAFLDYSIGHGVSIYDLILNGDHGIGLKVITGYNGRIDAGIAIPDPNSPGEWIVLIPTQIMVNGGNIPEINHAIPDYYNPVIQRWDSMLSSSHFRIDSTGNYVVSNTSIDISSLSSVDTVRLIIDGTVKYTSGDNAIYGVAHLLNISISTKKTLTDSQIVNFLENKNPNTINNGLGVWRHVETDIDHFHCVETNDAYKSDPLITYYDVNQPSRAWTNIFNDDTDSSIKTGLLASYNSGEGIFNAYTATIVDPSVKKISIDNRVSATVELSESVYAYMPCGLLFFVGEQTELASSVNGLTSTIPQPPATAGYTPLMYVSKMSYYKVLIRDYSPILNKFEVKLLKNYGIKNNSIQNDVLVAKSALIPVKGRRYNIGISVNEYRANGTISVFITHDNAAELFNNKSMVISVKDFDEEIYNNAETIGLYAGADSMLFSNVIVGSPAHAEVADIAYMLDGNIRAGNRVIRYNNGENAFQYTEDGGANWTNVYGDAAPGSVVDWANITNKPTEYNPSAHTHTSADITDFSSAVSSEFALKTTDDLPEGVSNLYYTNTRVSANSDVAANTAARHNAVTIGTSGLSAKLGLSGQELSLATIAHADLTGVTETDHHPALSAGVGINVTGWQASINPADSINWTARQYFDGGLDAADADIYGELHSAVFVKDETAIHAGDIIVVKSAGTLASDYTVGGTMVINDPPSGASWLFDTGDDVRIKAENTTGMGDTWVTVTQSTPTNTYTTVYKSGTNSVIYPSGTGVADYGTTTDGGIRIQSNAGLNKLPRIDGFVYSGASSQSPFFAMGDIAGISDAFFGTIPSGVNGLYAKDVYLTGQFNITNGEDITNIDGGNIQTGTITADQVNADFLMLGGGAGVTLNNVALHLPFSAKNGAANLNGSLGQAPSTASGSIIGVYDGKFGSGALGTVQSFTNLIKNPSAEVNTSNWGVYNGSGGDLAVTRDTAESKIGSASFKLTKTATNNSQFYHVFDTSTSTSDNYSLSFYAKADTTTSISFKLTRSGSPYTTYAVKTVSIGTSWERFNLSGVVTTSGVPVRINLFPTSDSSTIWIDAVQATKTSYQLPYRDGDMNGCSWSGTAHASTTTVTGALLKYANPLSPYKGAIGGWVKVDSNATKYGQMLWTFDDVGRSFYAYIEPAGINLRFTQNSIHTYTTPPTAGTWFHIVTSWDYSAGEIKYYLNGAQVGSTVSYTTLLDFGTDMGILCDVLNNIGYTTNGYGADWFLSTEPMSMADVKKIYDSGVPVNVPHATHELSVAGDDGANIWLNADGLYAKDNDNKPSFALVNADGILWNGETLYTKDLLLGDNSTGKTNFLLSPQDNLIKIRNGTNLLIGLGDLSNISDATLNPTGYGLYASNVFLTGKFNITNGEDITNINGSHITTGTIDASVVNVTNINATNISAGQLTINSTSGATALIVSDGTTDVIKIDEGSGISFRTGTGTYVPIKWFGVGGMYASVKASTTTDYQDLYLDAVGGLGGTIKLSAGTGGYDDAIIEIGKTSVSDPLVRLRTISGSQICKFEVDGSGRFSTTVDSFGGYKINGTTVINSSGDWVGNATDTILPISTVNPSSPVAGQMYYNSVYPESLRLFDGNVWRQWNRN